ncbi:MFS general substrate transporter [Hypoxylon sp. NC0597]|nr:MFS general substrate transporter [Hypoxylon sp. NC0597]
MLPKKLGFLGRSSGDGVAIQPADVIQVTQDRKDEEQADVEKLGELPTDSAKTAMWPIYFVSALQSSTTSNLTAYVVSASYSNAMCAAFTMPVARILNLFDRSKGFLAMGVLAVIGLILMATCINIAIYCAAQVFYDVGFTSLVYSVDVMTADTSKLTNQGLAFAFTSSPYIITAFAGPSVSKIFYDYNWRWAFGCWAIILPVVVLALFTESSGRTLMESAWFYIIEFDLILLGGGLVLFLLLPFSVANSTANSWRASSIITMLVIGFVMLIAFGLVERYTAPKPFLPYGLPVSRTVMGACLLDLTYQTAGYIDGIFDIISATWLLGAGYLMRRTGRFRWLLQVAVPTYILFVGLLNYFRKPGTNIGYIVICEILIALPGGTMIIGEQVSLIVMSEHNDVAAVLALLSNVGGALGNSISGAIWTNTLPDILQRLLPDSAKADWEDIYDSLDVQLSYLMGSDVRSAVIETYAQTQTYMTIAGTVIMGLFLV